MMRVLNDVTCARDVPVSARCSECHRLFTTPRAAMSHPAKATRDFFRAFRNHKCEAPPSEDEETKEITSPSKRE